MATYSPTVLPHELVYACFPQKFSNNIPLLSPLKPTHLPSFRHFDMTPPQPELEEDEMSEDSSPDLVFSDWFSNAPQSSLHIAEKTCEMVCYLWFSTNSASSSPRRGRFVPHTNSSTALLQFCVSRNFVQFMQKVLETTQVSQSVIVLSLHYIYRLKERNRLTNGEYGSEFRVAIAALMMANKFVDDNTYTNKTWSDVSGIPLSEINKMEREILLGIDFSLYVDKTTYESWLNLLKGLVMAKEKDCVQWRPSTSGRTHSGRLPRSFVSTNKSPSYLFPLRSYGGNRARSTSPPLRYPFTFTAPTTTYTPSQPSYTPTKPGGKRSAADAFSPASVSFPPIKLPKRQMNGPQLSLSIPVFSPSAPRKSSSPMDLHQFSKLTLAGNSPACLTPGERDESMWVSSQHQHVPPKTLSAPWAVQDRGKSWAVPQNLYYYTLVCSPASAENQHLSYGQDHMSVAKKAKLRYYPAPQSNPVPNGDGGSCRSTAVYDSRASNRAPIYVHSASTSPNMRDSWLDYRQPYQGSRSQRPASMYSTQHHSPARLSIDSSDSTPSSVSVSTPSSATEGEDMKMEVPTLPPFNELVSGADGCSAAAYYRPQPSYDESPLDQPRYRYSSASSNNYEVESDVQAVDDPSGLQAAPFANAGPPGVHYGCVPSWEFQPYQAAYAVGGMTQYAPCAAGWVRTR